VVPRFSRQSAHEGGKDVSPTHPPPLSPMRYLRYSFLLQAESPHGHSAAISIRSIKNPNDPITNGTHDLPACSAVSQELRHCTKIRIKTPEQKDCKL
jgi:hypothetical protein